MLKRIMAIQWPVSAFYRSSVLLMLTPFIASSYACMIVVTCWLWFGLMGVSICAFLLFRLFLEEFPEKRKGKRTAATFEASCLGNELYLKGPDHQRAETVGLQVWILRNKSTAVVIDSIRSLALINTHCGHESSGYWWFQETNFHSPCASIINFRMGASSPKCTGDKRDAALRLNSSLLHPVSTSVLWCEFFFLYQLDNVFYYHIISLMFSRGCLVYRIINGTIYKKGYSSGAVFLRSGNPKFPRTNKHILSNWIEARMLNRFWKSGVSSQISSTLGVRASSWLRVMTSSSPL